MIHHFLLRQILWMGTLALVCIGCSSSKTEVSGETDNNFDQSSYTLSYQSQQDTLVDKLKEEDIQFVEYGDTMTLVIPTDKEFTFQSTQLKDMDYSGLNNVVKLLKLYPKSQFNIAGFSDNSGTSTSQKDLTQGRAETILSYLWANGIPAKKLTAQGYGDSFSLGSNSQMQSSAYNRRIEIQWSKPQKNCCPAPEESA